MTHKSAGRMLARRRFLSAAGASVAAAPLAAPAIATAQGQTTTWRVQSSWGGGPGLEAFYEWSNSIVEVSGGELAFDARKDGELVKRFDIYDGVRAGQLEAAHNFTIDAGRFDPAGVFLSSYPLAMRTTSEWDVFYYGLGGLELAREIYAKQNLFFVGPIHHGPNIIHSKKPIRYLDDFRGLKMRTPGGMVEQLFQQLGAETITLPGAEIMPAFQSGRIDAADFVGPSINYAYGFAEETKFISMGPAGYMSIYQPVDLMDLTVNQAAWDALSPEMKLLVEREVQNFSDIHHAKIQKADQDSWAQYAAEGVEVSRITPEDVRLLTKVAASIWFDWASRSPDAARVFKVQLDYMASGSLGYVEQEIADLFNDTL
ncbi:MAG: TRAP transporter substrate-binding protein DctP [Pseudomonadota bacterium]